MTQAYPTRATRPEVFTTHIRLLGVNGADPTKEEGEGVTVTRTGEGAYRIVFAEQPFQWLGYDFGFQAATPADVAGYTVGADTWDATNKRLDIVVYNSSFAAADIIAAQYLTLRLHFARTSG